MWACAAPRPLARIAEMPDECGAQLQLKLHRRTAVGARWRCGRQLTIRIRPEGRRLHLRRCRGCMIPCALSWHAHEAFVESKALAHRSSKARMRECIALVSFFWIPRRLLRCRTVVFLLRMLILMCCRIVLFLLRTLILTEELLRAPSSVQDECPAPDGGAHFQTTKLQGGGMKGEGLECAGAMQCGDVGRRREWSGEERT